MKEKIKLTPLRLWVTLAINLSYKLKKEYVFLIPVFASRLRGDLKIKTGSEHADFKWVDKYKVKLLLTRRGQREAVNIIEDYFLKEKSILQFVEIEY
jgi:hypothetical protein